MLKLEPMSKVRIIASKAETQRVVGALYSFGGVEIRQTRGQRQEKPSSEFGEIGKELVRLRTLAERLGVKKGKAAGKLDLGEALKQVRFVPFKEFDAAFAEATAAASNAEKARARVAELSPFAALVVKPETLESRVLSFAFVKPRQNAEALAKAFKTAKIPFQSSPAGAFVLVAFPRSRENEVKSVLEAHASETLAIPKTREETFADALVEAKAALEEASVREKEARGKIEALKSRHAGRVAAAVKTLGLLARKAELPSRFAATEFAVIIDGWVPSKNFGRLEKAVSKATEGKALVEEVQAKEAPPSVLRNPRLVKPFEFLVRFFSLPSQHEFDPTVFISLSFPVFFGMILGDVGYGLAAVVLALLLRFKFAKGFYRDVSGMMLLSGLSTVAFGFVYAEFFGFDNILGYHWTPLIHRLESEGLTELMALVTLMGLLHIALGFAIGVATAYRERHWKHAFAKASWLLAEIGLIAFIAASADITFFTIIREFASVAPAWFWGSLGVLGMMGVAATEGAVALMELPSLFSNLFSYLRIMALGVSAVILALIIDKIPLQPSLEPMGLLSFVLFAAFFTLAHVGALVLGLFESSIQSLRLHYVEFFSKFYKGGGIAFNPLSKEIEEMEV